MENKDNTNKEGTIEMEGKEMGKDANGVQHIKMVDPKKEKIKKIAIGVVAGGLVIGFGYIAYKEIKKSSGKAFTEIPVREVAQAAVQAVEPVPVAAPEMVNTAQAVVDGVQVATF